MSYYSPSGPPVQLPGGIFWQAIAVARMTPHLKQLQAAFVSKDYIPGVESAAIHKLVAAMLGVMQPAGQLSAHEMKLLAAFAGKQIQKGNAAATLHQLNAAITAYHIQKGTLAAQLHGTLAALSGKQTQKGTISAAEMKLIANLSGYMKPSGGFAAQVRQLLAAMSGGQIEYGSAASALHQTSAALNGKQIYVGNMLPTNQKLQASMLGSQKQSGASAAALSQLVFTGAGLRTGGLDQGPIASSIHQMVATLAGAHIQKGTAASTLYQLAVSFVGTKKAFVVGANTSTSSTVTIPTHLSGDTLLIFAFEGASSGVPSKPGAGGNVPTWNTVDSGFNASNICGCISAWATGTGSSTSGTWTNANAVVVIVIRGAAASPLGAHALSTGQCSIPAGPTAPSITPNKTDGSSIFVSLFGLRTLGGWSSFAAAPSGYTKQASSGNGVWGGVCVDTKNVTTSDGSEQHATGNGSGSNVGYYANTVEILS